MNLHFLMILWLKIYRKSIYFQRNELLFIKLKII